MAWIVGAVVLLVAAVVFAALAFRARRRQRAMITTETLSASELGALQSAAAQAAGPGSFRYACEVAGLTHPGPTGALKSELSQTECVWHRHSVVRKYRATRRDSKGRTQSYERHEEVAGRISEVPFAVADQTGSVLVRPDAGTRPDGAEQVVDRFEQARAGMAEVSFGGISVKLPGGRGDGTLGYRYSEWVLRPGQSVYVLGEAADAGGVLTIGKPSGGGTFVISTKSEADLLASDASRQRIFTILATAGVAVAIVLLLVGVI